ncbi:MAG: PKD domain-containing protein, partial [Cytophagaceae bacterium]
ATVTNGVTGTGVYTGPGVDASGNFSPSVAGPGTHTITYTFTSSGNCITPITQTIVVNAKAAAAFNVTASVCAGTAVAISNIASANINSWKWIFGDGNTTSYTNNTNFNYQYANAGSYEIKLVTTNANGCNSDTARQRVTVNPVPVASFTMPAAVCMPGGTASFTNTSTLAGGGTLSYSWNFNDGSPASTATNPGHVFPAAGSYNVTLRATSAAGCFKDSTQTFSAFFQKPVAAFTVNPASVCQGVDNIFTDASTAPGSSIKTRLWIFGDRTTSTQTNPVKRYSQPGIYTVKLVVTNNADCISDTFPTQVRVYLQPVIDAGPSFVVAQGSVIRFAPTVNDSSRTTFLWSPATGLSNPAVLRPTLTATTDQAYTLTATGEGNCTATDMLTVTIVRPLIVPNAFSPNGDATNDTWIIENIADYPNAVVEVFNRYGQMVYSSTGYSRPWDGTSKGKPLPVATYYYVINLKNGLKPLNGSITIIR